MATLPADRAIPLSALLVALLALPAAAQQVAFTPDRLRLEAGLEATTRLRGAASTLSQVSLSGPPQAQLEWRRTGDRVTVRARATGEFVLRARRGLNGPVLAELRVTVAAPVLERVLARVRAEAADGDGRRPIVAFDLDDTLFDTRYRTQAILQRWGRDHGEPRLADLALEAVRWDIEDTLAAAGLAAWEVHGATGRAAADFYWHHFSDYELDRPFPGAVAFVRAVEEAGGLVAYVTARGEVKRAKTEAVLEAAGFPVATALRLFRFDTSGSIPRYKGSMVRYELPQRGEVVACFENEPANANAFAAAAPAALQVFVDSQAPRGSPALTSTIETILDYRP